MKRSLKALLSFVAALAVVCTLFAVPASATSVAPSIVPSVAPYVFINNCILVEADTTVEQFALSYSNNTGAKFVQESIPGEIIMEIYDNYSGWQSPTSQVKLSTGSILLLHRFFKTSIIGTEYRYIAKRGDVTGDGKVDIEDVLYINNYYLGESVSGDCYSIAADVNIDGVIDIYDILAIQTYIITGQWNL